MTLRFETRDSASSWIDNVWTCTSDDGVTAMTSVASETWGLVFWRQHGVTAAAVTGPESRSGTAPVPEGATFVGVQLAVGTALRSTRTPALLDGGIALPDVTARSFWLDGWWQTPSADDVEALVARLVRSGVIVRDPVVGDALDGRPAWLTERSLERRIRTATGMTRGALRQIVRARSAAVDLMNDVPVDLVVDRHAFYDEPHLARALRRYVGRTAGALRRGEGGAIALDPQRTTSYTSLSTPLEYAAESRS